MSEEPAAESPVSGTRERILEAARELFGRNGFQRTSIREIAERLDLTKTAVLYHFSAKADILSALAEPLLEDLESAVATAVRPDPEETRWVLLEGLLDVHLAHRGSLRMILQDVALFAHESVFQRFVEAMTTANHIVSGPDPDLRERVRAAQAIAMLSDPVIILADAPTESLRREVLAGVRRLFPDAVPPARAGSSADADADAVAVASAGGGPSVGDGPSADASPSVSGSSVSGSSGTGPPAGGGATTRRRRSGRPGAMTPEMVEAARRMDAAGSHTMAEIAAALGVSRATLYRYLSPPAKEY